MRRMWELLENLDNSSINEPTLSGIAAEKGPSPDWRGACYSCYRRMPCGLLVAKLPVLGRTPQAGEDQLAQKDQLFRDPAVEPVEQLIVREDLLLPGGSVDRHDL